MLIDGSKHNATLAKPRLCPGAAAILLAVAVAHSVPLLAEGGALTLRSEAFRNGGEIPARHTCEGDDIAPPLKWDGVPPGTRSLVLIVDDPDAPDPDSPQMTWVHWVLYNLPPHSTGLPESADKGALPDDTGEGLNDWRRTGFGGPCPPVGRHRYFFKLYALSQMLRFRHNPTKQEVEAAMRGSIIEQAELVGTYRQKQ